MSSKSNLKKIRGTFLLGSTVAGIVGTAAASASAQVPGAQEAKNFFKGAYEGAKSLGSGALSGAKNAAKFLGNKISSGASSAEKYIEKSFNSVDNYTGNYMSEGAKWLGKTISKGLGVIDDFTGNIFSKGFNYLKNTSFGKTVSKVTSPAANFVKAHPYASVALSVVAVVGLYKLLKKRPGTEVKKRKIANLGESKSLLNDQENVDDRK